MLHSVVGIQKVPDSIGLFILNIHHFIVVHRAFLPFLCNSAYYLLILSFDAMQLPFHMKTIYLLFCNGDMRMSCETPSTACGLSYLSPMHLWFLISHSLQTINEINIVVQTGWKLTCLLIHHTQAYLLMNIKFVCCMLVGMLLDCLPEDFFMMLCNSQMLIRKLPFE